MELSNFDDARVTKATIAQSVKKLSAYRADVRVVVSDAVITRPESALATWKDEEMLDQARAIVWQFKRVKHVVLIGIGGSSLGTEAIHAALATDASPQLHVLDTISAFEMDQVQQALAQVKKVEQIAVCIVSKSGGTTETIANADVLLSYLESRFGKTVYAQTICIGNANNQLLKTGKKLGTHTLSMKESVGGRYSVFTSVGIVPLMLLGHDIEAMLSGVQDTLRDLIEETVAENAARLYGYIKKGYRCVNFFAFDTRLVRLGKWYRQLSAESLGKAVDRNNKPVTVGFVPVISTPVELHSTGQLYFSGFAGVYTDFVSFPEQTHDAQVSPKSTIAPAVRKKSFAAIHSAIQGGVLGAYESRMLPYRSTILDTDAAYGLGLFMGMRMLETMYVAELLNVNAFDQPNVELYKDITRELLKT